MLLGYAPQKTSSHETVKLPRATGLNTPTKEESLKSIPEDKMRADVFGPSAPRLLCLTLGPGIPQNRKVPSSGRKHALEILPDGGSGMGPMQISSGARAEASLSPTSACDWLGQQPPGLLLL